MQDRVMNSQPLAQSIFTGSTLATASLFSSPTSFTQPFALAVSPLPCSDILVFPCPRTFAFHILRTCLGDVEKPLFQEAEIRGSVAYAQGNKQTNKQMWQNKDSNVFIPELKKKMNK